MGTRYHVKVVVSSASEQTSQLEDAIAARLEAVNRSMSTYLQTSEISRFNRSTEIDRPLAVSADFLQVLKQGRRLYQLTEGAWDATVKPLVDLWGFGSAAGSPGVPNASQIRERLETVGFDRIQILPDGHLVKKTPGVTLDLASIAKGFGVDAVSGTLRNFGFQNFLVEVGGEIFASGHRPDGNRWRVGINRPRKGAAADAVYRVVALTGRALATSGDYRNFFEVGSRRYSHVIDPRSGKPVNNRVVSVTVLADDCTFADGLATALMVMGVEKGLALVDQLPRVETMLVVHTPQGPLEDHFSKGFQRFISQ